MSQEHTRQAAEAMQRTTMNQTRRAFEQAVDFQRNWVKMFVNGVETGESLGRQGTDVLRNAFYTYLDTLETFTSAGGPQSQQAAQQQAPPRQTGGGQMQPRYGQQSRTGPTQQPPGQSLAPTRVQPTQSPPGQSMPPQQSTLAQQGPQQQAPPPSTQHSPLRMGGMEGPPVGGTQPPAQHEASVYQPQGGQQQPTGHQQPPGQPRPSGPVQPLAGGEPRSSPPTSQPPTQGTVQGEQQSGTEGQPEGRPAGTEQDQP